MMVLAVFVLNYGIPISPCAKKISTVKASTRFLPYHVSHLQLLYKRYLGQFSSILKK